MEGTLLGPYRLLRRLGGGATSSVWLAAVETPGGDRRAGDRVALKVLDEHRIPDAADLRRFRAEAELGKSIRHDNVVRVLEAGTADADGRPRHWLAMEYVEGQTLRELVEEVGAGVAEDLARHVVREVARALVAVHAAGTVHRDVKPENVILTRDEVVKLADLGLARGGETTTEPGRFSGSLAYAAPEQFRGDGRGLDGRADLYALGLVAFELATGTRPFGGANPHEVVSRTLSEPPPRPGSRAPALSPFFEEVILTLLAKDPDERFPDARTLVAVLDAGEDSEWWASRRRADRGATGTARLRVGRETSLRGRDAERVRIRTRFAAVRGGDGRVVVVTGEAGIGKSRLADQAVADLAGAGEEFDFLAGAWPPGGAAAAASAPAEALVRHFGSAGLEAALRARLAPLAARIPAFAALLRGEPVPPGDELTKDVVPSLFAAAFRALAAERPVVLLLEDLHFAPAEGRALFAALAHAVAGHRILLVGTARPGLPAEWLAGIERLNGADRIDLDRLGEADVAGVIAEALRSPDLAAELAPELAVRSDGNPWFLFEILASLKERGPLLRRPDGTWQRKGPKVRVTIADSLRDVVRARVADLPEPDRELVDVAACAGFEFDPLLVAEALGRSRIPLLKDLSRLERGHGLFRSAGRSFVFDHHQLREVVHDALSVPLREEYHALLAGALARRHGAEGDEPPAVAGSAALILCRHWLLAGRPRRAAPLLPAALDHLTAGLATEEAAELATAVLRAPGAVTGIELARGLHRLGQILHFQSRWEEERVVFEEAVRLHEELGSDEALTVRLALGNCLMYLGRQEEAEGELERCLARARATGDRSREATAIRFLATLAARRGRLEQAEEHGTTLLAISRELGDRKSEMAAISSLARLRWRRGRYEEARAGHAEALALYEEAGNRPAAVQALGNLASLHYDLGEYDRAQANWERELDIARRSGLRKQEAIAVGGLGTVARAQGRFGEAEEYFRRSREIGRELGDRRSCGVSLGHLGVVFHHTGRLAPAREAWDQANRIFTDVRDQAWLAWGTLWAGQVLEAEGAAGPAAEEAARAIEAFRRLRTPAGEADSLLLAGWLRLEGGDRSGAAGEFAAALRIGREVGIPGVVARGLAGLARAGAGDAGEAAAWIRENESRLDAYERLDALHAVWAAAGDPEVLTAASRLLDRFVRHAPAAAKAGLADGLPLYRAVGEARRRG